jgi:exonuclease III
MDNRVWNILCWNIQGLNATGKCDVVCNKLEESACSIVFLQETKRDHFDMAFIKNFTPRCFDCFDFVPSVGASGGATNSLV